MSKTKWLAGLGFMLLSFGMVSATSAQAPSQGPSFAVYCRGPLSTFRTDGGKVITTPFKWAKQAAAKETPGASECAWAESAPQGFETKPGDNAAMIGNLGPFDSIPVGTIGKVCVSKASNNELAVRQVIRQLGHETAPFHRPPFTADGCPN